MPFNPQSSIRSFRATFEAVGTKKRAVGEKKYLKSNLQFYGVPLPTIRKTVKEHCNGHPDLSRGDILKLVSALWKTDHHELRSMGIGLLERRGVLLMVKDMGVVEKLVGQSETWAYVDWLAVKVAGGLILDYPSAKRVLPRWSRDSYMWVRRSSMLALLPSLKRDGTDFSMFSGFASAMIEEKDFFIRKAIGWVLREVSKKRPDETFGFLDQHVDVVSGLTLREGSKYLSAARRGSLMKRYRSR